MGARKLEVVPDEPRDEQEESKVEESPKSITEASKISHRDLLVALRGTVAKQIDEGVPAHALDKLVRIIRDLNKEIESLDSAEEGDDVSVAAETPDEAWTDS